MSLRYVHYPTGDSCPACGEPLTYKTTIEMRDGRQHEIGRDEPACWNGDCGEHRAVVDDPLPLTD